MLLQPKTKTLDNRLQESNDVRDGSRIHLTRCHPNRQQLSVVYIEAYGATLYAFDATTGAQLWSYKAPSMIGGGASTPGHVGAREAAPLRSSPVGFLNVVWRYIRLGFTHIIPRGLDHALFVLGLFLLSPRLKPLLWQITAFTIAHSITLFLTTFRVISMPAAIVEPTIAATIAFVAIENMFVTRVHPWRPAVAFIFGLVHGMGFASALAEVGLPTGQLVAAFSTPACSSWAGHC